MFAYWNTQARVQLTNNETEYYTNKRFYHVLFEKRAWESQMSFSFDLYASILMNLLNSILKDNIIIYMLIGNFSSFISI